MIHDIQIPLPDGGFENIAAEQITESTYKLLESPLFSCKINYGTVVQVDENLAMIKIVRASNYFTRVFQLNATQKVSAELKKLQDSVINNGGTWEIAMGGLFFIHILKDSTFELPKVFEDLNFYPTEVIEEPKAGA